MIEIRIPIPRLLSDQLSAATIRQDTVNLLTDYYLSKGIINPAQARTWRELVSHPASNRAVAPPSSKGIFTLFTDGACSGNPGPGGWGALLRDETTGQVEEMSGGEAKTTNNRMEMQAVVEGLKRVAPGSEIKIIADSEYVVKGMTEWIHGWLRNDWQTAGKKPVKNQDLWQEMYELSCQRKVSWDWVRGHAGHRENERCDQLAVAAYQKYL